MLTVGFILTPGFPVMSLAALSVFEFANLSAAAPGYEVHLLSEAGGPIATSMGMHLETKRFGDTHFDTLIIGGNVEVVATSPAMRDFVAQAGRTSRRICSICTGAFALAEAGLLGGRRVTTHWLFTDALKRNCPEARVEADRIFIQDGPVWTAAGNSAGIDLTLSLLDQDYGADLALTVARILVIDYQRAGGQSQHSALMALNPKTDRVQETLAYARAHLRSPLAVEDLARVAGLSPRQFSRAFRSETGLSPAKAIESLRLEAARLMIEKGRHPIEEIAAETGFGDQERMRRAFVRAFGQPPQALRRTALAVPG